MICNRITKPEFTKQQILDCKKCKHISGKKVWCCLFGVWIDGRTEVIQPSKKMQYPSLVTMGKSFARESIRHIKTGRQKRSEEERVRCIAICRQCDNFVPETKIGPRCMICGCCMSLKKRWATAHCKLGKW